MASQIVSISATSDIQVTFSDTLDRQDNYSQRRTVVSTGLGVSLSLWDRTTIYISGSTFASGGGGASFGAFVRHRLKRGDLLAELAGEGQGEGSAAEAEKGGDGWWDRNRARVGGIVAGLIVGASVRNLAR